jgi:hypothetical protein
MDEQEICEHRYRFFSEKGVEIAFEQDKILVTLFTGIVAGLVALLVAKQVGFWSGLCFLIADLCAVVGLGMCLLHMAFSAKVMVLLAALFAGEESVPNLIAREEPTPHAVRKNRVFAQVCYAGQLACLFWSVFFAGLGVVALAWNIVGWCGLAVAVIFTVALIVTVVRPLVAVYRMARNAFAQHENAHNVHGQPPS